MTTESFRKDITKQLNELCAKKGIDDNAMIAFPASLSSADRKYVHRLCEGFGLFTLSEGQGPARHIRVYITDPNGEQTAKRGAKTLDKCTQISAKPGTLKAITDTFNEGQQFDKPVGSATVASTIKKNYWSQHVNEDMLHIPMSLDDVESACDMHSLSETRKELPAWEQRQEVLECVQDCPVTLISGETGCGKSTQVPQFILDGNQFANILVAQPRRIAAISLANRVKNERGIDGQQELVGYHVPLEKKGRTNKTRLTFCTTGMLRRRLFTDPELSGVTHIIFDEVHERDKLADFALIFIRDLIKRRPDLRLILMSATLQLETFENYFADMGIRKCHIPGRTFPVTELYLDNIVTTLWKVPGFRKWLGPGILSAGLEMDEKLWKTQVFDRAGKNKDGFWGFAEHMRPLVRENKFSKGKLADGLARMDVLQQSGLDFDFPIIEALIMWIDKNYKDQIVGIEESLKEAEDDEEKAQKQQELEEMKNKPLGAILVFLTGWNDIDKCQRILETDLDMKKFKIHQLHGSVSMEQQQACFERAEPGIRKVVLTTNIAEASITVPDVEFVIDCGRAKETSYDPYLKVATLTSSWISKASVSQRAGRAGRTQGGLCFHLFSKKRAETGMDAFTEPELLRSPLEETCLSAKMLLLETEQKDTSIKNFLKKAPTPPEDLAIDNAIQELVDKGALRTVGTDQQLTPLGKSLCNSSLPPSLAKTVMWAALFGVLDDVLQIVGSTAFCRDPFMQLGGPKKGKGGGPNPNAIPIGKGSTEEGEEGDDTNREVTALQDASAQSGNAKTRLAAPFISDHVALFEALKQSKQGTDLLFLKDNNLSQKTVRQMADAGHKLRGDLPGQGLGDSDGFASRNGGNIALILAVLTAGLYPNIAVKRTGKTSRQMEVKAGKLDASAHLSTVYGSTRGLGDVISNDEFCIYEELTQVESSYSLKSMTLVPPIVLMLMAGEEDLMKNNSNEQLVLHEGWIKFNIAPRTNQLIASIRRSLRYVFANFCKKPHQPPSWETMEFLKKAGELIEVAMGDTQNVKGLGKGNGKGGNNKGGRQEEEQDEDGLVVGTNAWFQAQNQNAKRMRDYDYDNEYENAPKRQNFGGKSYGNGGNNNPFSGGGNNGNNNYGGGGNNNQGYGGGGNNKWGGGNNNQGYGGNNFVNKGNGKKGGGGWNQQSNWGNQNRNSRTWGNQNRNW